MLRLVQARRYVSLVPSGAKACGAGGGAFRPEWREGPVERAGEGARPPWERIGGPASELVAHSYALARFTGLMLSSVNIGC